MSSFISFKPCNAKTAKLAALRVLPKTFFIGLVMSLFLGVCCSRLNAWQTVSEPTTTDRYKKFVNRILQQCDEDKNGFIDTGEQERNYRRLFENADENRDGLISPQEILDQVSDGKEWKLEEDSDSTKSAGEDQNQHSAWRVRATLVQMPRSFAMKQTISLKEIFTKMTAELQKAGADQELFDGVTVIDQFEMDVKDRLTSKMSIGGQVARKSANGNSSSEFQYGSTVSLSPIGLAEGMKLKVKYDANPLVDFSDEVTTERGWNEPLPFSYKVVRLKIDSEFQFGKKKVAAANIFSAGNHFLFLLNVEPL